MARRKVTTRLITLPLAQLLTLRRNPQYLSERQTEALKKSIDRDGFLAPIVVRKKAGGKYEILSGNHRAMACRELGREDIACVEIVMTTQMWHVASSIRGRTLSWC